MLVGGQLGETALRDVSEPHNGLEPQEIQKYGKGGPYNREKSKNDGQNLLDNNRRSKKHETSGLYNSKKSKNANEPHGTTKKNPETPDNRTGQLQKRRAS